MQREKYATAYDSLASTGVPEYAVYIREGQFVVHCWILGVCVVLYVAK
jgi:hypothetical protein